ncbi:hypothetical protein ACP70R_046100 [Stipagrostis hirtigluma subsp. patula]
MSSMAWYPLPESEGTVSAGDEFFDNQSASWSIWDFNLSDEKGESKCSKATEPQGCKQSENFAVPARAASSGCSTGPSEEERDGPSPLESQYRQLTEDIFLSQFSDDEMRTMDTPFEALDMFPGSMQNLLSYENMLSGVLTGSEDQEAKMDQNGIDTMDTCGFPLFSHDLQDDTRNTDGGFPEGSDILADFKDKAGMSMTKRSRSTAYAESSSNMEAEVLEELEDVVFQKTRICFRDAFYRLAEGSKAKCTAADGSTESGSRRSCFQQPEGPVSRVSESGDRPERETNAIDRTVADLTLKPPCAAHPHECQGNFSGDDSATAEAQSTSSWITRA